MSSPKFRDLSTGSKSLVIIELILFAGSLLLTVYINSLLLIVEHKEIPNNLLVINGIVFALPLKRRFCARNGNIRLPYSLE